MRACPRCGAPMEDGDKSCAQCGAAVQEAPAGQISARSSDGGGVPGRKAGARRRRFLVPALVLLALLLVSGLLVARFVLSRQSGVHPARGGPAEAQSAAPEGGPQGLYLLSAYSWDDGGAQERGQWYLLFNGDGTGSARLYEQEAMGFTYSATRILFADKSSLPYQLEGDTVTLQGGTTLIFTRADAEPSAVTPTPEPGALPLNSGWTGQLEISGHKGEGSLQDGTMAVRGYLGETETGRQYFELYRADAPEGEPPILSMWVNVYGDHLVPVIGEEDAWLFYLWLNESDARALTLYYRNGGIRCTYRYQLEGEKCSVSFKLTPDR